MTYKQLILNTPESVESDNADVDHIDSSGSNLKKTPVIDKQSFTKNVFTERNITALDTDQTATGSSTSTEQDSGLKRSSRNIVQTEHMNYSEPDGFN